ncbi:MULTISPECIES: FeoA family protein [Nitrospirillum]|uniref:Ferrous iron transport protein A n=1 Tax=Nitrospirillum amazonense TaxID=28077 RepID=A0A560FQF1_9PROT|nr:FeoA family protein [Nitrospirillum amazonense]MEC4592947.1 FeoA family protein [Nitrospirillum amazonense]TWB23857.1 ferrous iron transport protein A [Nitrospirillum amazonense]
MHLSPRPAAADAPASDQDALPADARPLSRAARGEVGRVIRVGLDGALHDSLDPDELERRLLEIGFVEGARVEILHEGLFGRDPIAVKVDDMRVALRRREAEAILITAWHQPAAPRAIAADAIAADAIAKDRRS